MANVTAAELENIKLIAETLFEDERDRREYVRDEIKVLQKFKLELEKAKYTAQLEAETKKHEIDVRSRHPNGFVSTSTTKKPKLPAPQPYNAETERLDRFFDRFEVYAKASGYDDKEKAIALASLISGETWTVVQTMAPEDQLSFSAIKKTLLNSFQYTTEGFKMRFKNMKPASSDNFARFSQKVLVAYDDWLKSANVKLTVEALRDFFAMDLIYEVLPSSLKTYIKERDSKTLQDVIKYGDTYIEARPNCSLESLCSQKEEQNLQVPNPQKKSLPKTGDGNIPKNSSGNRSSKHNQKQIEELAKSQTILESVVQSQPPKVSSDSESLHSIVGESYCSKHGAGRHSSEQCYTLHPELKPHTTQSPTQVSHISVGLGKKLRNPSLGHSQTLPKAETTTTPDKIPSIKAPLSLMHSSSRGFNLQRALLQQTPGKVNGNEVNILLDSGAESVFVDSKLVDKDAYLGDSIEVEFPEGPPVYRPLVKININCSYFKGEVTAVALYNPRHAVFLGRIPGTSPFPGTKPPKIKEGHSTRNYRSPRKPRYSKKDDHRQNLYYSPAIEDPQRSKFLHNYSTWSNNSNPANYYLSTYKGASEAAYAQVSTPQLQPLVLGYSGYATSCLPTTIANYIKPGTYIFPRDHTFI